MNFVLTCWGRLEGVLYCWLPVQGVLEMPSQHLCAQCLLQSLMLSQGSFSYFDPEHKVSFVLRIKGRGAFEEQGSYVFFMYIMTKINACYHATVQVICFSIVWQIDNSLSRAFLNIAQCTIGIDCASTSLFGQWRRLFFSYNFTILQFSYNFSLVVANCFFFIFCFVCFTLFSRD